MANIKALLANIHMPSTPSRNQILDSFKSYLPTRTNVVNLGKSVLNNPVKTTAFLASTYVANQLSEIPYFKEVALGVITASVAYNLAQTAKGYFTKKPSEPVQEDLISAQQQEYCSKMASTFNTFKNVDRFQASCVGIILTLPISYMDSWLKISGKSANSFIPFLIRNDIKLEDIYAIWRANPNCSQSDYEGRCETFDKIYGPKKREIDQSIFNSKNRSTL